METIDPPLYVCRGCLDDRIWVGTYDVVGTEGACPHCGCDYPMFRTDKVEPGHSAITDAREAIAMGRVVRRGGSA